VLAPRGVMGADPAGPFAAVHLTLDGDSVCAQLASGSQPGRSARQAANVRCAYGSSGGRRLIMRDYVTLTGPTGGAIAAGGD